MTLHIGPMQGSSGFGSVPALIRPGVGSAHGRSKSRVSLYQIALVEGCPLHWRYRIDSKFPRRRVRGNYSFHDGMGGCRERDFYDRFESARWHDLGEGCSEDHFGSARKDRRSRGKNVSRYYRRANSCLTGPISSDVRTAKKESERRNCENPKSLRYRDARRPNDIYSASTSHDSPWGMVEYKQLNQYVYGHSKPDPAQPDAHAVYADRSPADAARRSKFVASFASTRISKPIHGLPAQHGYGQ
jgi:hypothetical protein